MDGQWSLVKSINGSAATRKFVYSVTFWCGSGSADHQLCLMDPVPTPNATPFVHRLYGCEKQNFIFFVIYLPAGTISSVLKFKFWLKFGFKILFCKHYFSPLNTFMRKGEPEPDPDLYL